MICVDKIIEINNIFLLFSPSRIMIRCPAVKFAVRRTDNEIGRIINPIVSIKIMNGISIKGVPWGKRWAKNNLVLFIDI